MSTKHRAQNAVRISRRDAMRKGLCGAAGLLLANRLGVDPLAAAAEPDKAPVKAEAKVRAKSVIQIFLWGGMSHNDTWDPKPDSGQ